MNVLRSSRLSRFIGDRDFYKRLIAIALPIIIQNGITNFVNLLDNLMVGAVGTEQMSGVAVVNQLISIFNLCIFGGLSGAGIYCAQFVGQGDQEGVRHTFRFKLVLAAILLVIWVGVFLGFGEQLIELFMHEGSAEGDIALTMASGREYMMVMLLGLLPFALQQAYASTLRESGETVLPMKAGLIAICVNLVFNWLLIFGNLGFPRLGVAGAAYATVLSRFVECAIIVIWTHGHGERNPFIVGAFKNFRIPAALAKKIARRGLPLLLNEFLWSAGMTVQSWCYSTRGLDVLGAMNIASTITNLFFIILMAMGNSVAIIVGQLLGAGKFKEAREADEKLIFTGVIAAACGAAVMGALSGVFPLFFNNVYDSVRSLASEFILVSAFFMPMHAFLHTTYFTLRAGGRTMITFLYDCAFTWVVVIPVAMLMALGTDLPIVPLYTIVVASECIKVVIGAVMLKKGIWINNLVGVGEKNAAAD